MKQTAVEWLVDYIENQNKNGYEFHPKYNEHIVQQAKEMEKQQKGYSDEDMLKLVNALNKISQFSDIGNDFSAVVKMKSIAVDAINQFKNK